jgi:hypothetical protein
VRRNIIGPKAEEVKPEWRILYNEELNLQLPPKIKGKYPNIRPRAAEAVSRIEDNPSWATSP